MSLLKRLFARPAAADRIAPSAAGPSWGLSIFSREPAAAVLGNLAWHLEAGAREIHLFLDNPSDPAAASAAALPGVRVTLCDNAFWSAHGGRRPAISVPRQMACARKAYRDCQVDWLIHLDADEFLWPGSSVAGELAAAPPGTEAVIFPVRERAFTRADPEQIFEGIYRIPARRGKPVHPLLAPNQAFSLSGLTGHSVGKSATRTGLDMHIGAHFPWALRNGERIAARTHPATTTRLLHFDGFTPRAWMLKFMRYDATVREKPERFFSPQRQAQIREAVARRDNPAALKALHDQLKLCADPLAWERAGLVERIDFDPAPVATRWLGDLLDVSVAGFDAELRRDQPEMMRGL